MVPDTVYLFKLVWHPDNLDGANVLPTAFRKDDLSGLLGKHVSVDRSDLSERATMEALASRQAAKANGRDIVRAAPLIGRLVCFEVRQISVGGVCPLAVDPEPIPGNPAHCGIRNTINAARPDAGLLLELRTKLAIIASPAVTFEVAYTSA